MLGGDWEEAGVRKEMLTVERFTASNFKILWDFDGKELWLCQKGHKIINIITIKQEWKAGADDYSYLDGLKESEPSGYEYLLDIQNSGT